MNSWHGMGAHGGGYERDNFSGERTRLACWRWRHRHRGLSCAPSPNSLGLHEDCFGEAPKPAREARALPRRN